MKTDPTYSTARPVRLWVRLDPASVVKLDRHAEHRGITRAALLHLVIGDWLEERPDHPEGEPAKSKRAYDQSIYMRERLKARERALAVAQATGAMNSARESLEEHFREITAALSGAAEAIEAAGTDVGADFAQLEKEQA